MIFFLRLKNSAYPGRRRTWFLIGTGVRSAVGDRAVRRAVPCHAPDGIAGVLPCVTAQAAIVGRAALIRDHPPAAGPHADDRSQKRPTRGDLRDSCGDAAPHEDASPRLTAGDAS